MLAAVPTGVTIPRGKISPPSPSSQANRLICWPFFVSLPGIRVAPTGATSGLSGALSLADPNPSGRVRVRPVAPADLVRIAAIEALTFPIDAYPKSEFRRLYSEHPGEFFVAELGDKVVGYVAGSVKDDTGEIESIAVDPRCRQLGIGRMLAERLIARFAETGLRNCFLQVRTTNAKAIDLYRRLGFRIVGTVEGYYEDGADAFVMEKALGPV